MRAVLKTYLEKDGQPIQKSYTFSNIKLVEETEFQTVYTAMMNNPVTIPCTVVITENSVNITMINGDRVNIKY